MKKSIAEKEKMRTDWTKMLIVLEFVKYLHDGNHREIGNKNREAKLEKAENIFLGMFFFFKKCEMSNTLT